MLAPNGMDGQGLCCAGHTQASVLMRTRTSLNGDPGVGLTRDCSCEAAMTSNFGARFIILPINAWSTRWAAPILLNIFHKISSPRSAKSLAHLIYLITRPSILDPTRSRGGLGRRGSG